MDVSRNGTDIALRTPFSPTHDLVQVLHGIAPGDPSRNNPVDFRLAGLQRKGHPDIWHVDQVLAYSTDECSPFVINGDDIGGNHGHGCAVRVRIPAHGLSCREVGLVWQDDAGMRWTLLRVENAESLLFLSDNIGASVYEYDFADRITGVLRRSDSALFPHAQQGRVQLTPAIRHLQREAVCLQDGRWQPADGWHEGCEAAEIHEVYEVVNPATVADAIRRGRPEDGYAHQPSLAAGDAMLLHRMRYHIHSDGTIFCDFDHRLLQPVHLRHYLGIMHQEKCDAFGGGVWRVIPKLKPFGQYDFSVPYNTTHGPMPACRTLTPDLWTDPLSPPDRQMDFIRRPDGSCAAAFACGFLPVHDGKPSVRARNITDAGDVVASRKTYPTFAGGRDAANRLGNIRGVAYKKYFLPQHESAAVYRAGNMLYVHLFAPGEVHLPIPEDRSAQPAESCGVEWRFHRGKLTVTGENVYVTFELY